MNRMRRQSCLDLQGVLHIALHPHSAPVAFHAVISDLSSRGGMVIIDVPRADRIGLFEGVHGCILELDEEEDVPPRLWARSVYLQPQTSAGDFVTFRIGLIFDEMTPLDASRIENYAARAAQKTRGSWFTAR